MGDPKKLKKQYTGPRHPWVREAIESERIVKKEYGLKNKREIFKANSFLKKYKDLAKKLIANHTTQGAIERKQILLKLQKMGLLSSGSDLENILNLQLKDYLERRLQTIVYRKGLAHSIGQARQYITHRHVRIAQKEITSPSYIVLLEEENAITFKDNSALANAEHPERTVAAKPVVVETAEDKARKEAASRHDRRGSRGGQKRRENKERPGRSNGPSTPHKTSSVGGKK